jgi:hypothetical protein
VNVDQKVLGCTPYKYVYVCVYGYMSMDACLWMHVSGCMSVSMDALLYGCTVSMDVVSMDALKRDVSIYALCLWMHCLYGCTVLMDACLCFWMHECVGVV